MYVLNVFWVSSEIQSNTWYVCVYVGSTPVAWCLLPRDLQIHNLFSLSVLGQGVQAAHPVLHQRRHWMSAGDIWPDQSNVPVMIFKILGYVCKCEEMSFSHKSHLSTNLHSFVLRSGWCQFVLVPYICDWSHCICTVLKFKQPVLRNWIQDGNKLGFAWAKMSGGHFGSTFHTDDLQPQAKCKNQSLTAATALNGLFFDTFQRPIKSKFTSRCEPREQAFCFTSVL